MNDNVHPIFGPALQSMDLAPKTDAQHSSANLEALERLLKSGANPVLVLETAYHLGKLDGQIEMASIRSA